MNDAENTKLRDDFPTLDLALKEILRLREEVRELQKEIATVQRLYNPDR
jgi:hypothetical protein